MSAISLMTGMETLDLDRGWDYKKNVSSSLSEWQENNFSLPATVAGRLDKLLGVKPRTISTNLKSRSQRQLYYGRIVTSVQNFCNVHFATKF